MTAESMSGEMFGLIQRIGFGAVTRRDTITAWVFCPSNGNAPASIS